MVFRYATVTCMACNLNPYQHGMKKCNKSHVPAMPILYIHRNYSTFYKKYQNTIIECSQHIKDIYVHIFNKIYNKIYIRWTFDDSILIIYMKFLWIWSIIIAGTPQLIDWSIAAVWMRQNVHLSWATKLLYSRWCVRLWRQSNSREE